MRGIWVTIITCGLILSILAPESSAQISGSVVGTVQDSTGAVVPNVAVTLTNNATNIVQTTVTTSSGDFRFPLVPVGEYRISAEMSGFKIAEVPSLTVVLGQATRIDIALEIGDVATTVEVTGAVATLQTEQGSVQGLVYHEDIVNLPLNGRNFVQLVALQPHAVPVPRRSFANNFGGYNVIAGAPTQAAAVSIDGINILDINDPRRTIAPPPDAIQEFQESQSSYSAATGLGGGAQVNLVTKSGTNAFHGALWEFLRNDKLDARNFFDSPILPGAPSKPAFRQNQFGGSVGGPIIKDKSFFFTSYEGLRIVRGVTSLFTVPTLADRSGDFSALNPAPVACTDTGAICDPTTGLPFPGNMIPTARHSTVSVNALNQLFPLPNRAGTATNANNLVGPKPNDDTNDQFLIRIDHNFSENVSLYGRYIYYNYRRLSGAFSGLPNFADDFNTPAQNAVIGYVHTLGPHSVNQFRIGYHRMTQLLQDVEIDVPINQQIGITGTSTLFLGNPAVRISGFSGTGAISNAPNNRSDNSYYLYEDFTHTRGSHTYAVGFNLAIEQINGGINSSSRGRFNFNGGFTGSAVADFLLGFPSSSNRGIGIGFRNFRQNRYGLYFNDDWKASANLTLNLGLRYEFFEPAYEKRNNMSGFDETTGQIVIAGESGIPRGLRVSRKKGFQPRVGFAYRIPCYKMVVRGGYGVYLMPLTTFPSPFINLLNAPFFSLESFTADTNVAPVLTLANAFPVGLGVGGTSLFSVDRNFKDPYLQQWNLTIQRELTSSMTLEVGYVGNKGSQLRQNQDINAPFAGPFTAAFPDLQSKRRYPAFTGISSYNNIGKSTYHSGHIKLEKRFTGGLLLLASHTWAKLLSAGGILGSGDIGTSIGRNPLDPNAEKARSVFDARHRFAGSFVWVLPLGRGHAVGSNWSGWVEQVAGNWQVNGILIFQSGLPVTAGFPGDNSNTGLFQDRPDLIGDPNTGPKTVQAWFNTSAFIAPATPFSYGNAGRNLITVPGISQFDFSIFKNIDLTEQVRLQFRTEFFNITNHPNFDPPGGTFGTGTFGVISSADDARQIQFALKLLF